MFDVNKEFEKYIFIKPKYFSRKEINDLNILLSSLDKHVKSLELKNKNQDFLINENKMLKIKLNTIKYNLDNIEKDNRNHDYYCGEKGMKDIIILLNDIKECSSTSIKLIICILLIVLKYVYNLYLNNKR